MPTLFFTPLSRASQLNVQNVPHPRMAGFSLGVAEPAIAQIHMCVVDGMTWAEWHMCFHWAQEQHGSQAHA
jgi:hypothetical protein